MICKTRHLSLMMIAALLAGCASGSGVKSQSTVEGNVVTTYDDAKFGVRLTYPTGWEEQSIPILMRPKGTILVLVASGDFGMMKMPPTISFVEGEASQPAQGSAAGTELDDMQKRMIDKASKQIDEFKLIESANATFSGEPARRIVYSGKKMGISLMVMNLVTLHAGNRYAAAYSADPQVFDDHRASAQKIIDSLQWMK